MSHWNTLLYFHMVNSVTCMNIGWEQFTSLFNFLYYIDKDLTVKLSLFSWFLYVLTVLCALVSFFTVNFNFLFQILRFEISTTKGNSNFIFSLLFVFEVFKVWCYLFELQWMVTRSKMVSRNNKLEFGFPGYLVSGIRYLGILVFADSVYIFVGNLHFSYFFL